MRKLIIKRHKFFGGCLGKMKVYVEDFSGERVICGVNCRKLGDIKNGEEQTFEIPENEVRVFVIADNMSKNYCCDMRRIPAGFDDVFLSGRNKFNILNGNAFRFDGEPDEETLALRKKGTKKGAVVIIVAIIIGFIIGFLGAETIINNLKSKEPQVFSELGMSITLNGKFEKYNAEGYNLSYISNNTLILMLKEEFALIEGFEDYTISEYGELVIDATQAVNDGEVSYVEGLPCFEYDYYNEQAGVEYSYFTVFYKSSDAFWTIQFCCTKNQYEKQRPQFIEWAKGVQFTETSVNA